MADIRRSFSVEGIPEFEVVIVAAGEILAKQLQLRLGRLLPDDRVGDGWSFRSSDGAAFRYVPPRKAGKSFTSPPIFMSAEDSPIEISIISSSEKTSAKISDAISSVWIKYPTRATTVFEKVVL